MAELKISVPLESIENDMSKPELYRSYTPIDELGDDALCDNYIFYDECSVPVKVTIDEAIQIIIKHNCHIKKSYINIWNHRYEPLYVYLSKHNPDLLEEINNEIGCMVPDPYEEFLINYYTNELKEFDENPESHSIIKKHNLTIEKKRKEQMGEKYDEYFKLNIKIQSSDMHRYHKKDLLIESNKIKNDPRYIELKEEYLSINK
jgi:hypothetical protein